MADEKENRLPAAVEANRYSWRTGQVEVFNWCLVQIRQAWAAAEPGPVRDELAALGKEIRTERDRRFLKAEKEEAANDETPTEPTTS